MQSNSCVYIVHINACGKANNSAQVVFIKWDKMLPNPDIGIFQSITLVYTASIKNEAIIIL